MEHIIVKELENGYYELTPENGYKLVDSQYRLYSQAVTKNPKQFRAVLI